jgi:multidrug efflux system outer membrane protein
MNLMELLKLKHRCLLAAGVVLFLGCTQTFQSYIQPENMVSNDLYRDLTTTDSANIADVPWKELFTDPLLQSLIAGALENNLDLQIAVARIKKAEANFKQSKAGLFPSLDVNAAATFQKFGIEDSTSSERYDLNASSKWEADIWGKLRGTKRANLALLLQSEAYRRAVQTQLIADIANTYFKLLAFDEQLRITEKTVELRKEAVEAIKLMKESNVVSGSAVVQSQANRYSVEVTLPDLKKSIYEAENSLCILLGKNPGSITRSSLEKQRLDLDLNTGIPAQLLANRPDVQEAEYQLKYAFEMTNVARAYFYPALNITAQAGFSSGDISDLFDASSFLSSIIGSLTQPIFSQGKNKQRLKVAQANQEEYLAAFKRTLLSAGQEVSDALFNYQTASEKISIRANQIAYLEKSVEFTKELLKYTSSTNYTDVLTSEQGLLAAQLNGVNDKLQQLQAVVTLYRSLGGGWKE